MIRTQNAHACSLASLQSGAFQQSFPAPRPVVLGPWDTSETLTCKKEMVGRIIGKEGETIKALQEVTGAKIQINQQHITTCVVYVTGSPTEVQLASSMVKDIAGGCFKGFALLRSLAQQRAQSPGSPLCTTAWPYYVEGYGFVPPSQVGVDDLTAPQASPPQRLSGGAGAKGPRVSQNMLSPTGVPGAWSQQSSPSVSGGSSTAGSDGVAEGAALATKAAVATTPLAPGEAGVRALTSGLQREVAAQLLARGIPAGPADVSAYVARALDLLANASLPPPQQGYQGYVTPRQHEAKYEDKYEPHAGSAALSHFYAQQQQQQQNQQQQQLQMLSPITPPLGTPSGLDAASGSGNAGLSSGTASLEDAFSLLAMSDRHPLATPPAIKSPVTVPVAGPIAPATSPSPILASSLAPIASSLGPAPAVIPSSLAPAGMASPLGPAPAVISAAQLGQLQAPEQGELAQRSALAATSFGLPTPLAALVKAGWSGSPPLGSPAGVASRANSNHSLSA